MYKYWSKSLSLSAYKFSRKKKPLNLTHFYLFTQFRIFEIPVKEGSPESK